MHITNTRESWGFVARVLHWSIGAIILFQFGLGLYMTKVVEDAFRQFDLTQLHKSWGFVIFALACLRVAWRLANPRVPELPAKTPIWQAWASCITHRMLYLLMFAMPISGWVMSAASPNQDLLNIDNMVFDWFAMPDPWVPGVKSVADTASEIHEFAAWLLLALLALHAAAALKHHLVDRDSVLRRMTFGA
jgi:cytochrome b561